MDFSDADTDTIIQQDPERFIEAITANALYGKYFDRQIMVIKHQKLFTQWLAHHDRKTIELLEKSHRQRVDNIRVTYLNAILAAERAAKLKVLTSLPLTKKRLGRKQRVDMDGVTQMIKDIEMQQYFTQQDQSAEGDSDV